LSAEYASEIILKIGQLSANILTEVKCHVFCGAKFSFFVSVSLLFSVFLLVILVMQ